MSKKNGKDKFFGACMLDVQLGIDFPHGFQQPCMDGLRGDFLGLPLGGNGDCPFRACPQGNMSGGNGWGGRRENQTGRPKGSKKPEGVREQHQLRAYPDEWEMIQRFSRALKHGKREECEKALEQIEKI